MKSFREFINEGKMVAKTLEKQMKKDGFGAENVSDIKGGWIEVSFFDSTESQKAAEYLSELDYADFDDDDYEEKAIIRIKF
jgi:hypothetical protein